jgi:hypothetical protein
MSGESLDDIFAPKLQFQIAQACARIKEPAVLRGMGANLNVTPACPDREP